MTNGPNGLILFVVVWSYCSCAVVQHVPSQSGVTCPFGPRRYRVQVKNPSGVEAPLHCIFRRVEGAVT